MRQFIIRLVCDRAVSVHSVSTELTERLVELGVPAAKIVQWPMGVDVEVYRPAVPTAPSERLICTRKHEPIYDIPTIIDALAILRRQGETFSCTFVGGGHLLDAHRARAAAAGLDDSVEFTGAVSRDAIPGLLNAAGTYVSASHADGTSSSLLEAMASGLLPVVSRIPANTPWVEHGRNGLLFDPRQPEQLAAALTRARGDAELRQRAAAENRARVERDGNLARNLERMRALLESAAANARRGAA